MNIEIASELVDLIMDVTNETYEVQCASAKRKMEKDEWREFMDIFKQGKKVSLRNV